MSLVVPVVLWATPPTHAITAVACSPDGNTLVTGSKSGQVCFWGVQSNQKEEDTRTLQPRIITTGQDGPITALDICVYEGTEAVLSVGYDRSLFLWNLTDGRCLVSARDVTTGPPTVLNVLAKRRHIILAGEYWDIDVVDLAQVKVACSLHGHTNWVVGIVSWEEVVEPREGETTIAKVILSLSLDGTLRQWHLQSSTEFAVLNVINIGLPHPRALAVHRSHPQVTLVVMQEKWMIYERGVERILTVPCPTAGGWRGGSVVDERRVVAWTKEGQVYLYKLPPPRDIIRHRFRQLARHIWSHDLIPGDGGWAYEQSFERWGPSPTESEAGDDEDTTPSEEQKEWTEEESSESSVESAFGDAKPKGGTALREWRTTGSTLSIPPLPTEKDKSSVGPSEAHPTEETEKKSPRGHKWSRLGKLKRKAAGGAKDESATHEMVELRAPMEDSDMWQSTMDPTEIQENLKAGTEDDPSDLFLETKRVLGELTHTPQETPSPCSPQDESVSPHPAGPEGAPLVVTLESQLVLLDPCSIGSGAASPRSNASGEVGGAQSLLDTAVAAHASNFAMACTKGMAILGDDRGGVVAWKIPHTAHELPPLVSPFASGNVADGWDVVNRSHIPISATALLMKDVTPTGLVFGHVNGDITVSFLPIDESPVCVKAHDGKVNCLLAHHDGPGEHTSVSKLVSGSDDSTIRVWSIQDNELHLLRTLYHHTAPVRSLYHTPNLLRGHKVFCSVGEDHTVGICSLQDLDICYLLAGHTAPVESINWTPKDEYLYVRCDDGSVYVWQMQTWLLERKLVGREASDVLANSLREGEMFIRSDMAQREKRLSLTRRRAIEVSHLFLGRNDPTAQILLLNIKRLSAELHRCPKPFLQASASGRKDESTGAGERKWPGFPYAALSYLFSWGLNEEMDHLCREVLCLRPPYSAVCYGVLGYGQIISLLTPGASQGGGRWQCSPHLTSLHALSAISLFRSLMLQLQEHQNFFSNLITYYAVFLPESLTNYRDSSLALLARYCLDSWDNVQQASRSLFEGCIGRMTSSNRRAIAHSWSERLPSHVDQFSSADIFSMRGIAVVVLGVIGAQYPECVAPKTAAIVVQLLIKILKNGGTQSMVAADLLGKGFGIWRPHLPDAADLIRQLFFLILPSFASGMPAASSVHQALMTIGAAEPELFIKTMGGEAIRRDVGAREHTAAIVAVISLIKKHPGCLQHQIPLTVESIIRSLDPSIPALREHSMAASTVALRELVNRYPTVSFHQRSQRLAVGTRDAVIIVYDLQSATKWRILEGHKASLTAVAFAPNGSILASYSAEDQSVRSWQAGSHGILGMLGMQGRMLKVFQVPHIEHTNPQMGKTTTIRLEWVSGSTVVLTKEGKSVASFTVT